MYSSPRDQNKQKYYSQVCARAFCFAPRVHTMTLKVAVLAACAQLWAASALAQDPAASATIEAAAEALGMVRSVQRRMDSINTVQFSATGSMRVPDPRGQWNRYEVTRATIGMSYYIPALRWDVTRTAADGNSQRTIHVVNGDRAWDEDRPGIGATSVLGQAAIRRQQIWLTPHGIIRAAVEAEAKRPGSVRVGTRDGKTTLTVEIDGTPIVATLDQDNRPERVGMPIEHPVLGRTRLEASYTDYVDWQLLDVYFPSRIVQTLGQETTLDFTVSEFYQNPYVVFPTPEQLTRSPQ